MIDENHHLDHEQSDDDGKQIEAFRFDADNQGDGHQSKAQQNGSQGKTKRFDLGGLKDPAREGFADEDKIDDAGKGADNETFGKRFLSGKDEGKGDENGGYQRSGAVRFLGLSHGIHSRFFVSLSFSCPIRSIIWR